MINATYFLFLGLTSYVIYRVTNSVWQSVLGAFLVLIMNGLINGVIRGLWARRRGRYLNPYPLMWLTWGVILGLIILSK